MKGHIPRKRFGQNFLVDPEIIRKIVASIALQANDCVVEVGPGLGALTEPLLQFLNHIHVVEIDRDLIARLRLRYTSDRLTIHEGDALKFDFSKLGHKLRIVGNLPYNISTPLLFHFSRYTMHLSDMHFMLQKEVVDRMVAQPGHPEYGRLSVMLQYRFNMERLFLVPSAAFAPSPKVESAIVRMTPFMSSNLSAQDEVCFSRVVAAAFGQRRKMLRNTLDGLISEQGLSALGISPTLRAEGLTVQDYVRIANAISATHQN